MVLHLNFINFICYRYLLPHNKPTSRQAFPILVSWCLLISYSYHAGRHPPDPSDVYWRLGTLRLLGSRLPKGYIIPCKRFNPYLPIRPWDKCDGGLKLKVLVLIQGTDIRRAKAQPVLVLILAFHGITLGCLMGHIVF